ncbi:MAG: hypothetical protein K0S27_1310 [Gammaproteobacteria bacterium]|jgi:hypothetical protein|nr:hypothetical protein [Gammaproteobacteria bacterium]
MASTTKKKSMLGKTMLNLILLIPTFFTVLNKITTLIEFEARLATKNLTRLIVLSVVFGALLITSWIILLFILFNYFQSLLWSVLFSLCVIFLLNIALLIIVSLCLANIKKNVLFPEIRHQLHLLSTLFRD